MQIFEDVEFNGEFDRGELATFKDSYNTYTAFHIPLSLTDASLKQKSLDEPRKRLFIEISILEAGKRVDLESDETLHITLKHIISC